MDMESLLISLLSQRDDCPWNEALVKAMVLRYTAWVRPQPPCPYQKMHVHLAPVVRSSKCEGYERSPENASLRLLRDIPKYLIVPDLLLENPTWPLICSHCHILLTYTLCDKRHFSVQGSWAFQTSVCWKPYTKTCTTSLLAKRSFLYKILPLGRARWLGRCYCHQPWQTRVLNPETV